MIRFWDKLNKHPIVSGLIRDPTLFGTYKLQRRLEISDNFDHTMRSKTMIKIT